MKSDKTKRVSVTPQTKAAIESARFWAKHIPTWRTAARNFEHEWRRELSAKPGDRAPVMATLVFLNDPFPAVVYKGRKVEEPAVVQLQ